jgi:hypothetical protein
MGVWFQTKVVKQGDGGEDSKKGLAKVNKHRKVKNYVRSQMVQRNTKALKKSVEEGRRWKAEPSVDERNEKNNLTKTRGSNLVLARCLPLDEALVLDQPVTGQLPQLIFRGGRRRPVFSVVLMATNS